MIDTQIFESLFNSDDSIYYLPDLNEADKESIAKSLKNKEIDLNSRRGIALTRCVDRYSDKYLKSITQSQLLDYLDDEFRSINLSLTIAKRYIKDRDPLPLKYLLKNDARKNKGSLESYKAMILMDLLPEGLQGIARSSAWRNGNEQEPLWKVLYHKIPMTPASVRVIIRDYIMSMRSYKMFHRSSPIVHFATEAYSDYPSNYNLNLIPEIEKAYEDQERIFPLQDSDYDLPEWRNYKIELYLRMAAQYLSGKHLLVEILPWNKLDKYFGLVKRFIVDMTTVEELQSEEELNAMRLASKEHENYGLVKDLLEDRSSYLLNRREGNIDWSY